MTETDMKQLDKVAKIIAEAALLHLKLGIHSRVDAIAAALTWRFEIDDFEARVVTKSALKLLDAMPKKGS